MKYVGVVGSRDFEYRPLVLQFVQKLDPHAHVVISGGARGVDRWAEKEAERLGVHTGIYKALWDVYKNSAGHMRNPIIAEQSDFIVAFWNGSSGTKGTMEHAHRLGKKVYVVRGPELELVEWPFKETTLWDMT